ncbi:MAG: RNA polymerase factor sigma-54 [Treponema sp.]|nr:RNA polymerase factor sigma-54 [Treponema sp.]
MKAIWRATTAATPKRPSTAATTNRPEWAFFPSPVGNNLYRYIQSQLLEGKIIADRAKLWDNNGIMQQRQSMIQSQQLKMNTQLYQSIKLMELPILDLQEKIGEEIEKNPALEVLEERGIVSQDAVADAYAKAVVAAGTGSYQKEEEAYFETSSDAGFIRQGMDEDEHQNFLEGAISRPETLQEHLLWQLALETGEDDIRRIGELLIQNLDDDGFYKEATELFLKDENPSNVEKALALVRSLEPPGTCTSGYKESLLVQARLLPDCPPVMEAALDYLKDMEKGNFAETAQVLGCTKEELEACYNRIKESLSPFPGRQFAPRETRYAIPDVEVRRKDGELSIILNNEEIPVLGINPFFLKIAEKKVNGREARDFVRENIKEARWFIYSINQRNHTLLRVTRAIVEFQRSFFLNGPRFLIPLTLKDIAVELGVHETTISRTANSKYVQTEWGLFELRHFFTNSVSRGSDFSKEGVKEILKEIITGDEKRLTDSELTDMLAQRGIALARRTVAKYRKELDLGSSYTR